VRSHDIDDTVRNVGRRVAELRSKAGLTQEQHAERLGFTLKYHQRVEGGGENLTVRSLVKIDSVFGVGVTELFRKPRTKQAGPGRPRQRGKTGGKNGSDRPSR
jgi:transcriptional regulator with XRE-family HTH domain